MSAEKNLSKVLIPGIDPMEVDGVVLELRIARDCLDMLFNEVSDWFDKDLNPDGYQAAERWSSVIVLMDGKFKKVQEELSRLVDEAMNRRKAGEPYPIERYKSVPILKSSHWVWSNECMVCLTLPRPARDAMEKAFGALPEDIQKSLLHAPETPEDSRERMAFWENNLQEVPEEHRQIILNALREWLTSETSVTKHSQP